MFEPDWSDRLSKWAHAQADIKALVQIGSRVQAGAVVDKWSDFDYQLITSEPVRYLDGAFAAQLGPSWAVGARRAFGNAVKVSAVYEDALEADFVILRHWEVRIATAALRWAQTERWWPLPLRQGTRDLRRVAGLGWKVIKGGPPWEDRYRRLTPFRAALTQKEFASLCGEFWSQLVWVRKKIQRGEFLAAQRAFHGVLLEHVFRLWEEETLQAGRAAWPEARRAEQWLLPDKLQRARIPVLPDGATLVAACQRITALFVEASEFVSRRNGWFSPPYSEIRAWLDKCD